jgi:ribosome recycling factor
MGGSEPMNLKEYMKELEKKMDQTVEGTRKECASIRTGRASIALLDGINVEVYGGKCPIRQVAGITVPDARTLVVNPWDRSILKDIEKAILASDLGITPNSDGQVIRLAMPALTEERRKDLAKQVRRIGEEGKVALRNIRRKAKDDLDEGKKDGDVPEDEAKRSLDEVQKMVDAHIGEIDQVVEEKNQEIMEF